jgi:hypothetical protein
VNDVFTLFTRQEIPMQNNQQQAQDPSVQQVRLHPKDLEAVTNFCKQHIDTQFANAMDFIPEILKQQGLKVVPEFSWTERAKQGTVVAVIAITGGVVGAVVSRKLSKREKLSVELETEKEPAGQNRVRAVGTRLSATN